MSISQTLELSTLSLRHEHNFGCTEIECEEDCPLYELTMRPSYQTAQDIAAEKEVMTLLSKLYGGVFHKLPIAYELEYAYYDTLGDLTAWCEIKCRSASYTYATLERLGGYMLSFHKWLTAYQYAALTKALFVLIVRLGDGVYTATFDANQMLEAPVHFRQGGRQDRADWQDSEVCVYIPMKLFEKVDAT